LSYDEHQWKSNQDVEIGSAYLLDAFLRAETTTLWAKALSDELVQLLGRTVLVLERVRWKSHLEVLLVW
jgi:hypothetical protein